MLETFKASLERLILLSCICIQLFFDSLQVFFFKCPPPHCSLRMSSAWVCSVLYGHAGGWHRGVWVEKRVMLQLLISSQFYGLSILIFRLCYICWCDHSGAQ